MTNTEHTDNIGEIQTRLNDHIKFSAHISKKQMAEERFCYMHKWFEYRFMSPEEATRHFAKEYKTAYRRHWRETRDREEADKKVGIRGDDWLSNSRELTSIWSARQHADMLGVPYSFFILRALEAAARRGTRRPPRPNQLFTLANLLHVMGEWERSIDDGGLRLLCDPTYREENFYGLHAQVAYRDWLVERIKAQYGRPYLIGRCVLIDRVLPAERAADEFGEGRLVDARREVAGNEAAPVEKVSKRTMLPACFALPQALSPGDEPCATCPVRSGCGKLGAIVTKTLVSRHAITDPVGDRKRVLNAARQQKFRDRKREAATSKTSLAVFHPAP